MGVNYETTDRQACSNLGTIYKSSSVSTPQVSSVCKLKLVQKKKKDKKEISVKVDSSKSEQNQSSYKYYIMATKDIDLALMSALQMILLVKDVEEMDISKSIVVIRKRVRLISPLILVINQRLKLSLDCFQYS